MFVPYTGVYPYAFLSYSHKDTDRIFPLMEKLQEIGCNIWFDAGIHPSDEWADTIAKKLAGATVVLLILSENSILSDNVRREIYYAVSKHIQIIPFYIDNIQLPDGLELQLGIFQALKTHNDRSLDIETLFSAFPQKIVSKNEPKLLYSCSKFNYYFCIDSIRAFSIIKYNSVTHERTVLFKNEQREQAEIESVFNCYSLRFSYGNDFYSLDGKRAVLFNIFCDHVSDRYVPRFYVDYSFAIISPGDDSEEFKMLECKVKDYSKEDSEIIVYHEDDINSSWKNQI